MVQKKCCRYGILKLETDFHKKWGSKDAIDPRCLPCKKKYYFDNRDRVKQSYLENRYRTKKYHSKSYDKTIARKKIILITDVKQILICVDFAKQERALDKP